MEYKHKPPFLKPCRRTRWRSGYFRCLSVLGIFVLSHTVNAEALVINLDVGSQPTQYEDAAGQPQGIYPEILRRAFASMGIPAQIRSRPFRRLLAELDTGDAAVGAFIVTPERKAANDFSAPYFIEHVAVFHLPQRPVYRNISDLKGYRVGVIHGWSYGTAFDQAAKRGEFQTEAVARDWQNFEKLLRGRLDYVVATELAGRAWQLANPGSTVTQGKNYLLSASMHLAFNKRAGQTGLLNRFDQAVQTLQQQGEIERIVAREVERSKTSINDASSAFSAVARR